MRPGTGPRRALGPTLLWAVVFADIGTSVYYAPGILYRQVGVHAALFVSMTLVVFVLLSLKYAEIASRYPEGGGVVTVASHAIHPFAGLLGGLLILVDYFLTAALSALSGLIYLSVVASPLKSVVIPATVAALILLGVLNWLGVKASAEVTAVFAIAAAATQLATVIAVIIHVGPAPLLQTFPRVLSGPTLGPLAVLTGYAGAFLAFSGLESIAQLAPAMATPRFRVARRAMVLVIWSIVITSPLLTLWSTTLLNATQVDPDQFISHLGGYAAGQWLLWSVAITASLLLVFASNTAIIGTYHVLLALSRMRFLPGVVAARNKLRQTPHVAIGIAVLVPLSVVLLSRGDTGILGDLYAFGLLGGFTLSSLGLDIVRWHEGGRGIVFWIGVITTFAVALAWSTNLFAKPMATLFGGGVTIIGLSIALTNYYRHRRRGRFAGHPHIHRERVQVTMLRHARRMRPAEVLVVLPRQAGGVDVLVRSAAEIAQGHPIVLLYRGSPPLREGLPDLMELVDPYLDDDQARHMFDRVERLSRGKTRHWRYVYLPSDSAPEALREVWRKVQPKHTLMLAGAEAETAGLPTHDVVKRNIDSVTILDYRRVA